MVFANQIKHIDEMCERELVSLLANLSEVEKVILTLPKNGMYSEDIMAKVKQYYRRKHPGVKPSPLAIATVMSVFELKGFWRYHYTEAQPGLKFYSLNFDLKYLNMST